MAERPLVIPEPYNGEGPFDAWAIHFENVATLNGWSPEQQLQWLAVRLVGRAQIAFQNLAAEARGTYVAAKTALLRRFDPESKRGLYAAEFHARQKQPLEDWACFAEDLKTLVNKAFPDIEEAARERMAVDKFLRQLDDPQLAFSVRQKRPSNLDEVVTYTLEMQAHLSLSSQRNAPPDASSAAPLPVAGVGRNRDPPLGDTLRQLVERMERLETILPATRPQQRREPSGNIAGRRPRPRRNPVCYRCGDRGHIARNCPAPQPQTRPPGN